MTGKKSLRTMLALLLILALFLSAAFLLLHSGHDCAGEHCAVCARLEQCGRALFALLLAAVLWAERARLPGAVRFVRRAARRRLSARTLTVLKVKLSD